MLHTNEVALHACVHSEPLNRVGVRCASGGKRDGSGWFYVLFHYMDHAEKAECACWLAILCKTVLMLEVVQLPCERRVFPCLPTPVLLAYVLYYTLWSPLQPKKVKVQYVRHRSRDVENFKQPRRLWKTGWGVCASPVFLSVCFVCFINKFWYTPHPSLPLNLQNIITTTLLRSCQ